MSVTPLFESRRQALLESIDQLRNEVARKEIDSIALVGITPDHAARMLIGVPDGSSCIELVGGIELLKEALREQLCQPD